MQTPDTPRSRETERLMALWRQQNPDVEASAYNREWESVYGKLEFLDGDELTQAKLDWFWNHLREMGCRTFEEMTSEDHAKLAEAFFSSRIQFESDRQRTVQFQGVVDALGLTDEDRRWMVKADDTRHQGGFIAGHPPKRRRLKNVRPATKGAFGKPKHLRLR